MDWLKWVEMAMAIVEAIVAALRNVFPKTADLLVARVKILELLKDLASLLPMPALTDSAACRAFLGRVLVLGQKWAAASDTTLDDQLVQVGETLLSNDAAWNVVWAIFDKLVNADDDQGILLSDPEVQVKATEAADVVGIDPATIIAIITAIVQLIQLWKNRNAT